MGCDAAVVQGALEGTDLRWHTGPKTQNRWQQTDFCRFTPAPGISSSIWNAQDSRRLRNDNVTIDTEITAKRKNIISELITFGITKAKAKLKFGVKYLCNH